RPQFRGGEPWRSAVATRSTPGSHGDRDAPRSGPAPALRSRSQQRSLPEDVMSVKPQGPEPSSGSRPKTTVLTLAEKHRRGQPITMLTAYDYPTARAVDEAGVDAILVGDSLAMVVLGHPNTLAVTMEEMLHHARAVSRGAQRPLLIGDMPFMSYQSDAAEAVRN